MYPDRRRPLSARGSALIITLSILALITAVLLAFFSQSALNRQISFSGAGQARADFIARSGLDTVVGDLRSEVRAGSQPYVSGTNAVYFPTSSNLALPCRVGDQGFGNLVKQSTASKPFWSGAAYTNLIAAPVRAAPGNNTLTPSANGRAIAASRWNAPGLLGDPGSGSVPSVPSGYVAPDWIVVTRNGAVTNASGAMPSMKALADAAPSNPDYAVGRFAYAVYDEGALLDVNAAGYPSSLNATDFAKIRGLLPQVDLSPIPGVKDANAFVQWRNQATAATAATYTNSVLTATNGFLTVSPGDQALVGRQDLINYAKANPGAIQTAALPYLGTFTRMPDGPAWFPDPARAKVNTTQDDIVNPSLLKIRVGKAFARPDGTTAAVGDPLLKHRFPLSRLGLFADPTGNAAPLLTYFAMQRRNDGQWDYVDPDSHNVMATLPAIKTLDQVALAGREPTYWELLQAGILTGSLAASNSGSTSNAISTWADTSATRQILSIGLNLIDQYDTDDVPTVLRLAGTTLSSPATSAALNNVSICGVENIPYVSWIAMEHFRDKISTPSAADDYIDGYLFFTLWNPHRNAPSSAPGQYRLRFNGQTSIQATNGASGVNRWGATFIHKDTLLTFQTTAARNFAEIASLLPSDAILGSTSDAAKFPYIAGNTINDIREVGVLVGQIPNFARNPEFSNTPAASLLRNFFTVPLTIVLEKQVGTNWIPCQVLPEFNVTVTNNGLFFSSVSTQLNNPGGFSTLAGLPSTVQYGGLLSVARSDPRTARFGFFHSTSTQGMLASNCNLVSSAGAPFTFYKYTTYASPNSGTSYPLADYAYNASGAAATSRYADPDTTVRKADANPATITTHAAYSPFAAVDARPIVLN
ncbi:MAG TPA: hypothetical protein VIM58_04205, partial [Candidatus Methylacidiphilales bacterium]